jgi:hypothetical protein
MTCFFATTVATGLIGFCTAAQSTPLTIQPAQEIQFDGAGSGGIALHGTFLLAGVPGGQTYPPISGSVNICRKMTDPQFGAESLFRNGRLAVASEFGLYIYERQDEQWVLVAKLVSASEFSIINSLDSMDWDANTLVAVTTTGIAIFDLSSLDARPAAAP